MGLAAPVHAGAVSFLHPHKIGQDKSVSFTDRSIASRSILLAGAFNFDPRLHGLKTALQSGVPSHPVRG
jgi:hypothetical protein